MTLNVFPVFSPTFKIYKPVDRLLKSIDVFSYVVKPYKILIPKLLYKIYFDPISVFLTFRFNTCFTGLG